MLLAENTKDDVKWDNVEVARWLQLVVPWEIVRERAGNLLHELIKEMKALKASIKVASRDPKHLAVTG